MDSIPASIVRFVFRAIMFTGYLLVVLYPTMLLVSHYRKSGTAVGAQKADRVAVRLANQLAWLFGIRVDIRGTPVKGSVLFAANHISWLDIPVVHSGCAMGFVGKAEIDEWPVFRFIARAGGTIFHQRGCQGSAAEVMTAMEERLRQDRAVAIFPEGGIKPGTAVRVFHARMFRPAVEVGCPVQPVMVRYMRDGCRDDDFSFRPGESMFKNFVRVLSRRGVSAEVHYLPEVSAAGKPRRELAETCRAAVVDSYES
jgi:1-acyl-sn-glycerol-3-phosphate acyltransferase